MDLDNPVVPPPPAYVDRDAPGSMGPPAVPKQRQNTAVSRQTANSRDPRQKDAYAKAPVTKTNPYTVKVWRKGNTGDLGKRGIEKPLWDKVQDYIERKAEDTYMVYWKDSSEANKAKCAKIIHYGYFDKHGIVVPASHEARQVVEGWVMSAVVDGQRFIVDRVDLGPLTIVLRVQYKPSDRAESLDERFKAALNFNSIPVSLRQQMVFFGVDRYAASLANKRHLIQFKVTRPAAEYLIGPEMKGKMFIGGTSQRIEYNGQKLESLEGVPFGYHITPPNQKPQVQRPKNKAGSQGKGPQNSGAK